MCEQAQQSSPLPAEAAPQEGGQPEEQGFSYYRDARTGEPIDPLIYLG